eukprot:3916511-Alexandrium_andersonii.AAC.1
MSASLVGSEMCIRDRTERHGETERLIEREPERPRERETESLRDTETGRPVSYTHLTLPTICSV